MAMRENLSSWREVEQILLADIVLIIAFSLYFAGGIGGFQSSSSMALRTFEYFLPIAAVGVSLSFILHEMMHKFFAQRYGAIAEFRTSYIGLLITLATGAFGFLIGIPGATVIYTNRFTDKENGVVSLVGPLTNFVIFGVFLGLLLALNPPTTSYLYSVLDFTIEISILLAFFNMLPIYPLDGSKVLRWNKIIYVAVMAVIFGLILYFGILAWYDVIFLIIIALLFSLFYRFTL